MIDRSEIADIMEEAAARFDASGWGQGIGRSEPCLLDMVSTVCIGRRTAGNQKIDEFTFINDLLDKSVPQIEVTAWNDQPGRQKQEVIDLLRSTAKDLRNEVSVDA